MFGFFLIITLKFMIQKISLCLLALLLTVPFSFANELEIAKRKLNKKSLTLYKDTVGYKVYSAKNGGFCIVNDSCVVAYSKSGCFTKSSLESVVFPHKKKLLMPKSVYDTISPLLSNIEFGQNEPYNEALPLYNGKRCITGCFPVALAQVMKYYNYPPFTTADIPGFKTRTAGLTMDSIPKTTLLDWQNIEPCYDSHKSKEKKAAVAFLMKIICTSCYTDLNVKGSPTSTDHAYKALVDYFGYDRDKIHVIKSNHYNITQFEKLVYNELSKKRPVLLGNSNHAFVCDGYENGLFHVNWGWGGLMNGYFSMSLLAPECEDDKSGFAYNALAATLGVVPNIGDPDKPMTTNLWVSSFEEHDFPETLSASGDLKGTILCTIHSNTYKEISSQINAGYMNENGKWVLVGEGYGYTGKYGYGVGQNIRVNCKFKDNTTYRIVPLEKCDGKDWEPMENAYYKYFDVIVENGRIKVSLPTPYSLKANLSIVEQEDGKFVKLDLKNSGYDDFCDTFYVKMNDLEECIASQELVVPANGNISELYKYSDSTLVSKYEVKVFDSKHTLLASVTVDSDKVKENVVDTIAQDVISDDETPREPVSIDPETFSVSAIALGLLLVFLLFIFFKLFG